MNLLETPEIHSSIELHLRTTWARAYVRFMATFRETSWALVETLLPVLGLSAYVFIYRAMRAAPEFTGYVILGGAMTAYWMNVLWSMASQFYWEKMNGQLEIFLLMPSSRMAILLGMALGGMFMSTLRAGSAFFIGLLIFRVKFSLESPFLFILAFLLTLTALYGLGMAFASLYLLWGREAWHLSNLFQEPIYLLSGFYFPVRALGVIVAAFASIIPTTLGLDAMRQLMFPSTLYPLFLSVKYEVLILGALSILFLGLASKALRTMEYLGKTTGTLSLRLQ